MEKDHCQVCYTAGCNNHATTVLKIPLGSRIQCIIHVCDACLPKYKHNDMLQHQHQIAIRDNNDSDAAKI
jgi:C4-type Zn-finger protein